MVTKSWVRLMVITIAVFSGDTAAGDRPGIEWGGNWSTVCPTVNWGWTFRLPKDLPSLDQLDKHQDMLEDLGSHLHSAEKHLEHLERAVDCMETKDCSDILRKTNGTAQSGVYTIHPTSADPDIHHSIPVYCRMEDGQGWTVLQRRQDGSVDFYRTWHEYKHGFGNLTTEFWLGNDNIHILTNQAKYKLQVYMETWAGETTYAEYDHFSTEDETSAYKLNLGNYNGTALDALRYGRGSPFSTWDKDNFMNIVKRFKGAWWFRDTNFPSLNGVYYTPQTAPTELYDDSIKWIPKGRPGAGLIKFVEMRIIEM